MKSILKLTFTVIFFSVVQSFAQTDSIIISEVMFRPSISNSEFIEIFNLSNTNSIDLSKYQIIYSTANADTLIETDNGINLPPKAFAVIFEGDYDLSSGIYSSIVPDTTIVLKIDNNSFGSSGMANTSDRTVYLVDSFGDTLDVYSYSANNNAGISDEKIILNKDSSSTNWENSIVLNGTPGNDNSVSVKRYDLTIHDIYFNPLQVFEGQEVQFNTVIKNIGTSPADDFIVTLFIDYNQDSLAQQNEIIELENYTNLFPGDSIVITSYADSLLMGKFNLFAEVDFSLDQSLENNLKSIDIAIIPKPNNFNEIVISEIMYAPLDNEPEWIEIYNTTNSEINLKNWRATDKVSSTVIYDSAYFIQPHEFIVLSDDESIHDYYDISSKVININLPSLNNSGDNLKLLDSLKREIDSVNYANTWGGQDGFSLEKIDLTNSGNDSTNWGSSVNQFGGTPGKENSITPKELDLAISHFNVEEKLVVVGESIQLNVHVKNIGTSNSGDYSVQIFHDSNRDSTTQENELLFIYNESNLLSNDSTIVSHEFSEFMPGENYFIAKIIYNSDMNNDNNISYLKFNAVEINEQRNDIVINEIMYAPNKPEPEWIELFNRSNKTIDLKNHQIADANDTVQVMKNEQILFPNQYFVIARDSTLFDIYSDTINCVISSFPTLNNSGDRIIILDSLDRVIDSLEFNPDWGGMNGVSLERINSEVSSVDSSNWNNSKLDSGGTPGMPNSISQRDYDIEITKINFSPTFPLYGESVTISASVKNIGKNNLTCTLQLFEDVNLDSTDFILLETSDVEEIFAGDSVEINFNYTVDSIKGERGFYIEALSEHDQDLNNNILYSTIAPGYSTNIVVVNEIMYSPINGEPEWIELFNTSDEKVSLKNWIISDIYTNPKTTKITDQNISIKGKDFIVIAKDSTILEYHKEVPSDIMIMNFANLNNDADGVVIKDQYNNIIDSVEYRTAWGGTSGYSLERRFHHFGSNDSVNWASSTDIELSTPGRQNSITPKMYDLKITSIKTEPEFPSINEEVMVGVVIQNIGNNSIENFSLEIGTKSNEKMTLLSVTNNLRLESGDSSLIKAENPFILSDSTRIISYVISELDNDTTNNRLSVMVYPSFLKNSIIINEFMVNPKEKKSEWIELYNNSNSSINIKNWFISDLLISPTKNRITEYDEIINSGEYFIITNDTSKFSNQGNCKMFEVNFGTLGNYDDGILLYDFNSKIIDSLRYDKDWETEKGRSLERVSFDAPASDIYNWLPSLSIEGATPGISNSVLKTQPYTQGDLKINEIMFDPYSNNSEFIEFYNTTDSHIDIGGWSLIDESDNHFELSNTFFDVASDNFFVIAADSIFFSSYPELKNNSSIKISNSGDLSLSNEEEVIIIIDHWGNTIDSVRYNSDWHNKNINLLKNKSLERINPQLSGNAISNWSTSVDPIGATPAKKNSIYTVGELSEAKLSFSPNPFSPDNDGYEDFTIINYNLSKETAQIRIKIFDDKGRIVRTLVNNKASASTGSEIFDGLDEKGNPLKIGMYIVYIEASNSISGIIDVLKDVLVVARKL
ncbi:MAG: lamin tail domain-containing protein [Bacteroidota bacterium]